MERRCRILFFIISFFSIKIFSYQPMEYGLLFYDEYKKTLKKSGSFRRTTPLAGHIMQKRPEKRRNGTNSLVFEINGVQQFLRLFLVNPRPVVLKIFSNNNPLRFEYQNIADKFKGKITFIFVNSQSNTSLVHLLFLILRSEGVSINELKSNLPLFLFCKKDFVSFQNGNVSFRKDGIRLVGNGKISSEQLLSNLQHIFKFKGIKTKGGSFSGRIKAWFKKIFNSNR